jgi:hypothetical protein
MGVNARLLVLGLFGVFPERSVPIRACAPLSSDSSESISLIVFGFGSRPDGRVARLCSRQRPSFGLRLLGRPLGVLDTQQGRVRFVIQNVARSLLPPVIPVPSGLVPLLVRHHSPSCTCA